MNKNLTIYRSDAQGKEDFVNGPLSDLIYQANTGWYGCRYHKDLNGEELVYLLNRNGEEVSRGICVTADSCEAIVRDVFKNL